MSAQMTEGLVVKSHSDFRYVETAAGILTCRLRGRLRLQGQNVLCGDKVLVRVQDQGQGAIEQVLPRRNVLERPPVANVDQAVVVFTLAEPPLNMPLLERTLVAIEREGLDVVLCLNKLNLVSPEQVATCRQHFAGTGYQFLTTSALRGDGLLELRASLQGRLSVLAGPSGSGKSSLLNALEGHGLATGSVSARLKRGRHTTRHVELFPIRPTGRVADTPGFSRLDLSGLPPGELDTCFPEFIPYLGLCRFTGCRHNSEPDCAVKQAVADGKLVAERYTRYLELLAELEEQEKKRW
ncbi:MAG TPA: ribosome small subunit-dependent GTPase A [Firmicutes bacterium]|nr:ribosome small subunit-dependent GTPase A [Bacillota bacterium]